MIVDRNQVVLPINLEIKIADNDPVRKLIEICEELDYTKLYSEYLRSWRKVDPVTMFELLVCAYMNGIYSSRKIEDACRYDVRYMWILNHAPVPDYSTIARFQNGRLANVIEDLFYQLMAKLIEIGEISYTNVFVDGTKIEANANRYSFVWMKAVEKNSRKLNERIATELPAIASSYGLAEDISLDKCISVLEDFTAMMNIKIVSGRGKRKTQLQRDIEKLTEFRDRKERYAESVRICGKRKSYSKTDKDATFMRMKEDHMMNGQLKPGYNVQIGVESEYIVGVGLFPNPTDTTTLIPFLKRMAAGSRRTIQNLIADAGYSSEENFTYLEKNGQNAYIKPQDHEIRKTKKYKQNIYRVENLAYDSEQDFYICPNNKKLKYVYESSRKSDNGFLTVKRNYVCESCEGCSHRSKCFKGRYPNRKVSVARTYTRQKSEAEARITTPLGNLLRMNRSIQVEGAFGVIKEDQNFRRFLTRGKQKTEVQFFLIAFGFNIKKLCSRIQNKRFNKSLFKQKPA